MRYFVTFQKKGAPVLRTQEPLPMSEVLDPSWAWNGPKGRVLAIEAEKLPKKSLLSKVFGGAR